MKFFTAKFEPGGGHDGQTDEIWAYAQINLETGVPDASLPHIRVDIPMEFSSELTLGEWREQFRVRAAEAMRAAADAFEANSWPELHQISTENEDRLLDEMS